MKRRDLVAHLMRHGCTLVRRSNVREHQPVNRIEGISTNHKIAHRVSFDIGDIMKAILLAILLTALPTAIADEKKDSPTDTEQYLLKRIAELEKQVEALKRENAELRATEGPSKIATPSESPRTATTQASTKPISGKAADAAYGSIQEIFSKLPDGLRPKPLGSWDKFELPKVEKWLDENAVGRRLQFPLYVQQITVSPAKESNLGWSVSVSLKAPSGRLSQSGSDSVSIGLNGLPTGPVRLAGAGAAFTFECDEAAAKVWDRKKTGYSVPVTATIKSIRIAPSIRSSHIAIGVEDVEGLVEHFVAKPNSQR